LPFASLILLEARAIHDDIIGGTSHIKPIKPTTHKIHGSMTHRIHDANVKTDRHTAAVDIASPPICSNRAEKLS
jgi:hypothetical protein